jgi:thioredoxin-related protein
MQARWYLLVVLFFTVSDAVAGLREGELNPDLTNPGSVEFPTWFKNTFMDIKEDVIEAKEADKRVLLFFYQDGCPYCKKLIEFNFTQRDIVTKAQDTLDVVAVNMWGDREVTWVDGSVMTEKEFAKKMRVMFTPTMLFLDESGDVALRVNGYYHPTKFKAALNYVANHREKKERFAAYYNRTSPPPAKGELNQESFINPSTNLSGSAGSSSGYKLVLFEQKQCPNCDELHQDIFKRKESLEQLQRFDVYQLDMWSQDKITTPAGEQVTPREWAKELDIKFAPSLVFFNKQGKEVFRAEAYLKSFHVQSVMDYVASGAYRKQPEFQRYIDERAEHLREQGMTINLMQ